MCWQAHIKKDLTFKRGAARQLTSKIKTNKNGPHMQITAFLAHFLIFLALSPSTPASKGIPGAGRYPGVRTD